VYFGNKFINARCRGQTALSSRIKEEKCGRRQGGAGGRDHLRRWGIEAGTVMTDSVPGRLTISEKKKERVFYASICMGAAAGREKRDRKPFGRGGERDFVHQRECFHEPSSLKENFSPSISNLKKG